MMKGRKSVPALTPGFGKETKKPKKSKSTMIIPAPTPFDNMSRRFFGNLLERYADLSGIELDLQKAKMPITAINYLSKGIFGGIIFTIASLIAVNVMTFLFPSFTVMFFAFWFMSVVIFFVMLVQYPNSVAGTRRKKIDAVLPLAMGYIATMASADMPLDNIIYELSSSKEYNELAREAKGISVSTKLFGKDIITAVKEGAIYTPSQRFSEFLQGIITTMTSGGDLKEYFKQKAFQYQTELSTLIKRNTESLSVLAESYIIVGIMFPLILMVIIGTVTSVIPGEGSLTVVVLYIIVGVIIPVIAVMFALILSSTIGEVEV